MLKKTTRILITTLIILFSAFACEPNDGNYLNHFLENEDDIDLLQAHINRNYMHSRDTSRLRIVFDICRQGKRVLPAGVCDDFVISKMKQLKFREIRLEKEYCNGKNEFDRMYILVDKTDYYPTVFYVFDLCKEKNSFKSEKVEYEFIKPHWSLLIDRSFP